MILIVIATFFAASGGILFEIFMGSFGSYLFGDSVKVFSLTMGVYMFSMGLGAFAIPSQSTQFGKKFLLVETSLALIHLIFPILIWFAYVNGTMAVPLFWLTLMLSGILVGAEIPLLLGIIREEEGTSDRLVNKILASDYIGALAASLFFGFLLLEKYGLLGASSFSAILETLAGLIITINLRKKISKFLFYIFIIINLLFLFCSTLFMANSETIQLNLEKQWLKNIDPDAKVTQHFWTGFSFLTLTQSSQGNHTLYLNHQYQWRTGKDMIEYHEALTLPVIESFKKTHNRLPEKILILGGGDGFAASLINKSYGIEDITIVDIDPKIRELALSLDFWKSAGGDIYLNENIKYFAEDAFDFIVQKKQKEKFDITIIDLPDPTQPSLARFFTHSFFAQLVQRSSQSSMISIQSSYIPQTAFGREKFACLIQNIFTELNWNSQVLAINELEFFIVGSSTKNVYPSSKNERLPGSLLRNGSQLTWLLTDHLSRFNENCQTKIKSSLLLPRVLSI